ncbi:MAG TPA: hypothetical protein VFA37_04365 [Gaiellaceae bacterium]|nr:hypothetical protein [Gaiellaceae bacterium]
MEIEERELHFAPEEPLLAWRLFRIRRDAAGPVLSSPMYDDPDPTPWPKAKTAACTEPHAAPAPRCRCGLYAAIEGTLDSLPGYLRDNRHDEDPWAFAEVACSGRVFVDMRGVRAERAEIVRIALAEECWPDAAALAAAKEALGERYGVPVVGLAAAPGWLGRDPWGGGGRADGREGPPPEDATLDLDSLGLGP